jgi:hypothetical protein
MRTGNCFSESLYFGTSTRRDVPHTGLTIQLHGVPGGFVSYNPQRGSQVAITGEIETNPGIRERVSGFATWTKTETQNATFILHGDSSGRTYSGSWNCPLG